jgi:molybdopterin-containing oxidoreductase family iron-sulfur binding subunit
MSLVQIDLKNAPKYWRSMDDRAGQVENLIPEEAKDMKLDGQSRRELFKIMGASIGLAGLTACRRPVEHILPHSKGIDDYVPGKSYSYATAMSLGGGTTGLLVETYDGRPTKVEGNPDHPFSLGAANVFHQASVLGVYDPDRARGVTESGQASSWDKFTAAWHGLDLGAGDGLRILSESVTSPSLGAMRQALLAKYPRAKWIEFDAISRENYRQGAALAFGEILRTHTQFDKAKVVVSLDYDFLGVDNTAMLATRQFSRRRHVNSEEDLDHVNRLYVVESQYSITGMNADHRLRMKNGEIAKFAADLAGALGALPGAAPPSPGDKRGKFLAALAADLKASGGESLVVAGPRQAPVVHALAHLINQALGSFGKTVTFTKFEGRADSPIDGLKALVGELNAGTVKALVILGGNPAYTAPADLNLPAAIGKAPTSVYLSIEADETSVASKWHIPEAHFLESWSDARAGDGTVSIVQPMIDPLFGGKTAAEVVALIAGNKEQKGYDIVRAQWLPQLKEAGWRQALHNGVVPGAKPAEAKASVDAKRVAQAAGSIQATGSGYEVTFYPSWSTFDGRFANNAWLQELPEPMTKLVWTNAALVSPASAKALGVKEQEIVTISAGNQKIEAAVMIQPGHADNAISIALGYGRTNAGRSGRGIGYNAYPLRTTSAYFRAENASIAPTGRAVRLVTTQEHGMMEGRPIVREASLKEYKDDPKIIEEMSEIPRLSQLYAEVTYEKGYQWGMAIDLTSCVGCNACIMACQAENNSPTVGPEQVRRGREMHWLRLDRYYVGSEDEPQAVAQPLPCMQCENAPCENVCPVAATTHSEEGLNDMAYNRCVGTRYCANNCPFKVRHFNFLNYWKKTTPIEHMVHNPEVTPRMRGVMEKCTYCVQRIQNTKIRAKVEGRREIKDGEIVTACQQTCPADAIVFGNINDPNSRVSKLKKQERNYAMLAELNIRPRTTYLARLRNPNPELAG